MTDRPAPMLVGPVIAVSDLDRARAFYEDQLGLDGSESPGGWVETADDGTRISLLPGVSSAGSADWPVATFLVEDVHLVVRELRRRGVAFLGPDDLPFELDEDGVSVGQDDLAVAWFRDPDGNVLTLYATGP